MWNTPIFSTDVYHLIHWFFTYSILGWLVESIYMSICERKITNRGFIKGPICPIYGVGALSVYFILEPFAGNYIALFLLGSILATTLEYCTAKLMLRVFGDFWWDYREKPFNFRGILCLESSIAWGVYTVALFLFLQKFVVAIVGSYPVRAGRLLATFLIAYFLIDFSISLFKEKKDVMPKRVVDFSENIKEWMFGN